MLAALMENKECQLVPEDLASKALGAKEKKGTGLNTGQQSTKQQQERRHSAP